MKTKTKDDLSADLSLADQRFADLVEKVTQHLGNADEEAVASLLESHREYAERLSRLLPAMRTMAGLGPHAAAGEPMTVGAEPEQRRLGDFRILREIGRGGMGIVYEAEQLSLGRLVALKVLPFATMLDGKHLERFKNEARTAATLHHTHIVPVYSVGCERGVHYFAMQLIEGQSLAQVLDELRLLKGAADLAEGSRQGSPSQMTSNASDSHSSVTEAYLSLGTDDRSPEDTLHAAGSLISTEDSTERPEYFRAVARIGIQAAEALEHAHFRGVLHRDIKPANLMLDEQGHLWVTDFGLARLETETGMTASGDLLGTLRYMSPEQASGQATTLDERTDVYSLGATLYELLSLQPAFSATHRQQLLRDIAENEPTRPRKINRHVPADIETIVLKAMVKDPEDRYASVQQLADDLRRFLGCQAIHARRPSLWDRSLKWSRRHVAAVIAAALVLLVVSVGSIVAALLVSQQRRLAETHLKTARSAVETFLVQITDQLKNEPGTTKLQRSLLEDALKFYSNFPEQVSRTPESRYDSAIAYQRLADAHYRVDDRREAIQLYDETATILAELVREAPKRVDYRFALATTQNSLASAKTVTGGVEFRQTAKHLFEQVIAQLENLHKQDPSNVHYRSELVSALLGQAHQYLGQELAMRRRRIARALTLAQGLNKDFPENSRFARQLMNTLVASAEIQRKDGNVDDVESTLRQALTLSQDIQIQQQDDASRDWEFQRSVAVAQRSLGLLLRDNGQVEEGDRLVHEAIETMERVVVTFPELSDQRTYLIFLMGPQANSYLERRMLSQASVLYERVVLHHRWKVEHNPTAVSLRRFLCLNLRSYAVILYELGEVQQARECFSESLQLAQQFLANHPDDLHMNRIFGWIHVSCMFPDLREPALALAAIEQACRIDDHDDDGDDAIALGWAKYRVGQYQEVVRILAKAEDDPTVGTGVFSHGDRLLVLSAARWELGEKEQAFGDFEEAQRLLQEDDRPVDYYAAKQLSREVAGLLGVDTKQPAKETAQ